MSAVACSDCYGSGYGVDGKPCPCGCRPAPAIALPVAADAEPLEVMRANFEDWYTTHAADIKAAPIGSRDSMLQWSSWIAARSGNYVARDGWQISPMPWGPAGAPVAAVTVDTPELQRLLEFWRNEPYGTRSFENAWAELIAHINAWGAQLREAEKLKVEQSVVLAVDQAHQRAEKAQGDLAQANEWRASALAENMQSGARWAKRVADLEAQLARRSAPLPHETQQAIAAARAAGQTVATTPGGLAFMNDGAEPDYSQLDCPACGGSGHAGDVPAGSTP